MRPIEATSTAKEGPTKLYFGTEACKECHNRDEERKDALCRCTEFQIWNKSDKHKHAYKVLHDEEGKLDIRGKQIGKLLGRDITKAETGCISCHGVNVGNDKVHRTFKLEDGVSCAICHGSYEEWVPKHSDPVKRDEWRVLARTEKEEKFGMIDLWDSGKRTKLCASCHIGNADEGKFVTHAMYAAGHPPLPGFEGSTFSDAMPRHWQLLGEKEVAVQKLQNYDPTKLEQVELVLVSAAASFGEAMNLIASQAEKCGEAGQTPQPVLDFANFDCYACHHDLKLPSWRAMRGYRAAPGRPMPRPWPTALLNIAVRHAERDDAKAQGELNNLKDQMQQLTRAFAGRPFGDPHAVEVAAGALSAWSNQLLKELQDAEYTQEDARKLLVELGSISKAEHLDYDSARQIAWAFQAIYSQMDPKPANNSKIKESIEELGRQLNLTLPSRQDKYIMKELPRALELIGDYEPGKFKSQMSELAELLD